MVSEVQHAPFLRRNVPEKILGNFVVVRGSNLVKAYATGNSGGTIDPVRLVTHDLALRFNLLFRQPQFEFYCSAAGDGVFESKGNAKTVEVAGILLADNRLSVLVRVGHAHADIQPRRETVAAAHFLALQRAPD